MHENMSTTANRADKTHRHNRHFPSRTLPLPPRPQSGRRRSRPDLSGCKNGRKLRVLKIESSSPYSQNKVQLRPRFGATVEEESPGRNNKDWIGRERDKYRSESGPMSASRALAMQSQPQARARPLSMSHLLMKAQERGSTWSESPKLLPNGDFTICGSPLSFAGSDLGRGSSESDSFKNGESGIKSGRKRKIQTALKRVPTFEEGKRLRPVLKRERNASRDSVVSISNSINENMNGPFASRLSRVKRERNASRDSVGSIGSSLLYHSRSRNQSRDSFDMHLPLDPAASGRKRERNPSLDSISNLLLMPYNGEEVTSELLGHANDTSQVLRIPLMTSPNLPPTHPNTFVHTPAYSNEALPSNYYRPRRTISRDSFNGFSLNFERETGLLQQQQQQQHFTSLNSPVLGGADRVREALASRPSPTLTAIARKKSDYYKGAGGVEGRARLIPDVADQLTPTHQPSLFRRSPPRPHHAASILKAHPNPYANVVQGPRHGFSNGEVAQRQQQAAVAGPDFIDPITWRMMKEVVRTDLRVGEWAYNCASGELWWSANARKILGIQRARLRTKNKNDPLKGSEGEENRYPGDVTNLEDLAKRIHPADRKFVTFLFRRASSSGQPFDVSHRVLPGVPQSQPQSTRPLSHFLSPGIPGNSENNNITSGCETISGDKAVPRNLNIPGLPPVPGSGEDSDGERAMWCRMMCRVQFHSITKRPEKLLGTIQDISSWARSIAPPQHLSDSGEQMSQVSNEDHFVIDEDAKCVIS
mmetsp:Transcript_18975/g.26444  ORF Transcript_18975/g.26444 Transcript_18975/m.26444 type:complete len:761 (-) Transcript_18975:137-2419(-)